MKIGVYLCQCGGNISKVVDLQKVTEAIRDQDNIAVLREHSNMCSGAGQKLIIEDVQEYRLDRVVIASCSPQFHEKTFKATLEKAGLNPYVLEMANFREHCSWTHRNEPDIATEKAIDLLLASLAKVRHNYPLDKKKIAMGNRVLVIGGGVAGIQASLDLAAAGKEVTLIEKDASIGGNMARLTKTFPTEDCAACIISPKMAEVQEHPGIRLLTNTTVENVAGHRLHFEIHARQHPRYIKDSIDMDQCLGCEKCTAACPVTVPNQWEQGILDRKVIYIPVALAIPYKYLIDSDACLFFNGGDCHRCAEVCPQEAIDFSQQPKDIHFTVDTIIVATGYDIIDPREKPVFGYGKYRNVVTGLEMERIVDHITEDPPPREVGKRVGFIQCVGSRDEQTGREYCSRVCCMYAIKLASLLKQVRPKTDIYIFYTDIRAFGKGYEEYYKRSQTMGVKFVRGKVAELSENPVNKKLVIHVEDTLSRKIIEAEFDLIILSTGIQLSKSSEKIADLLKLSRSSDGFFQEAHPKFRPVDTLVEGVFLAGTAQGPKDIPDTVAQASAAASRVIGALAQKEFEVDPILAFVHSELCDGCRKCLSACPKNAIAINAENQAEVIAALCVGCGACIASCPTEALDLHGYTNAQLYAAVQGALSRKRVSQQRIIVFADDACTYRLADAVGIRKMSYSADVRIIRIPSAARITPQLILSAIQQGIVRDNKRLLTLCSMCYNTLKRSNNRMKNSPDDLKVVNDFMSNEIDYDGSVELIHFLSLLREIGFDKIQSKVVNPIKNLKVAGYYGCMLLRPKEIGIDNHETPTIMEDFIRSLGADAVEWRCRHKCCGSYLTLNSKDTVVNLGYDILTDAQRSGADIVITSCPLCAFNLDNRQKDIREKYPGCLFYSAYDGSIWNGKAPLGRVN